MRKLGKGCVLVVFFWQDLIAFLHRSTVRKLGKSCVLVVFFFFSKSSTMAAAGAIRCGHSLDGGI